MKVSTNSKWEKLFGYSRAVRSGNFIAIAGTTAGLDENGEVNGKGDIYAQAIISLQKIKDSLIVAGGDINDVIRTRIFVTDIKSFETVAKAHQQFFGDIRPASTFIEVSAFVLPDLLIEIEADAYIKSLLNDEVPLEVKVKTLPHFEGLTLPEYQSDGAAGIDLLAAIDAPLTIEAFTTIAIPTGLAIALPKGFEAQIRPRSGLALKHNIGIINSPGTIDCDYRGEVKVLLTNFSQTPFNINRGDRIAQMVIAKYERISWNLSDSLGNTQRGSGGFGHTGR